MFLATPQLVATLYFLCPVRPAVSILYFPAPYDQRRAFFIALCDERQAGGGRRNIKIPRGQRENRDNKETER